MFFIKNICQTKAFTFLIISFVLSGGMYNISAQPNNKLESNIKWKTEFGPEFIWPSSNYQSIHTTSANVLFWTNYFKKAKLNLDIGLTATYAWGTALDWYSSTNKNLIYLKTDAFGGGPIIKFSQNVFEINRFSISGTASAGAIVYNKHFPPGGDFYNFMLRAGLDFGLKMNENITLKFCTKWMHVSNGQGSGPHNPYYEGYGLGLTITKYFYK